MKQKRSPARSQDGKQAKSRGEYSGSSPIQNGALCEERTAGCLPALGCIRVVAEPFY